MSRPAQLPHAAGLTLRPPVTWASRQRQRFRAAPAAPRRKDSASTLADARGPSQGSRPRPARLRPRPCPHAALTCAFAGTAAPCRRPRRVRPWLPRNTSSQPPFRLPATGFRSPQDPPPPAGQGCPDSRPAGGDGERGGGPRERREARTRSLNVVRDTAADGGRGSMGFGGGLGGLSAVSSQALTRAVGEVVT